MKIVIGYPPNIDAIREVFTLSGGEIFCYGDIIYNPAGGLLSPALIKHEEVHEKQQGDEVEEWWDRYLVDEAFRFQQELPAHVAEYRELIKPFKDRNHRAHILGFVAGKLASDLYGNVCTKAEAISLIRKG